MSITFCKFTVECGSKIIYNLSILCAAMKQQLGGILFWPPCICFRLRVLPVERSRRVACVWYRLTALATYVRCGHNTTATVPPPVPMSRRVEHLQSTGDQPALTATPHALTTTKHYSDRFLTPAQFNPRIITCNDGDTIKNPHWNPTRSRTTFVPYHRVRNCQKSSRNWLSKIKVCTIKGQTTISCLQTTGVFSPNSNTALPHLLRLTTY